MRKLCSASYSQSKLLYTKLSLVEVTIIVTESGQRIHLITKRQNLKSWFFKHIEIHKGLVSQYLWA